MDEDNEDDTTSDLDHDESSTKKYDLFLSHSSKDTEIANKVLDFLESKNIKCWMAPIDITPGRKWAEGIIEGIEQSRAFLIILTKNSNKSKHVQREVDCADQNNLILYCLMTEKIKMVKSLVYYLKTVHWIDAVGKSLEEEIEELIILKTSWV